MLCTDKTMQGMPGLLIMWCMQARMLPFPLKLGQKLYLGGFANITNPQ